MPGVGLGKLTSPAVSHLATHNLGIPHWGLGWVNVRLLIWYCVHKKTQATGADAKESGPAAGDRG